ncbi:MFS transporter [Chloroflexota bacterium]
MVQNSDSVTTQVKSNSTYKRLVLLTVCISSLLGSMDNTIVNIALPELTIVFNTGLSTVIWILLAYMLTAAGLMLTLGRLGDVVGRKRVYAIGFVLLTLGLALCALAQNITQLIIFRVIQGVGGAMTLATGIAIVSATFGAEERGRAIGIVGTAIGIGLMSGPALGGLFLDTLGWRSIFYLRLPLSILGTVMAWAVLKDDSSSKHRGSFDIWGAITLFTGLTSLLFALNQGQARGWTSPFVLNFGLAGVILLSLFITIEKRLTQPILDLALFRHRGFASANISRFLIFSGRRGFNLILPFLLIQACHYPASSAGFIIITVPLTLTLLAPLSGWLYDRIGSRLLCPLGLAVICLGIFLMRDLNTSSVWSDFTIRLLILGIGGSLFETPNNSSIMGLVRKQRLGTASAMIETTKIIGQFTGLIIASMIFASGQPYYTDYLPYEQAILASFKDVALAALLICFMAFLSSLFREKEVRQAQASI